MSFILSLGQKQAKLSKYISGGFNLPESMGNPLVYHPDDLKKHFRNRKGPDPHMRIAHIRPFGIDFDWTRRDLVNHYGKPLMLVKDDLFIDKREIWVFKRFIKEYRTTTQVHVIQNKVQAVMEEIRKPVYLQDLVFPTVLKLLGIEVPTLPGNHCGCLLAEDSLGRFLVIEEDVTIRIRIQKKEL